MRHEKWKVLQVSSLIAKEGEEEAGVWAASRECQGLRLWLRAVLLGEDLGFI